MEIPTSAESFYLLTIGQSVQTNQVDNIFAKMDNRAGKRYHTFVAACDTDPSIKEHMRKWVDATNRTRKSKRVKTATGATHLVIEVPKDSKDMRFVLPKSKDGGKKKDGTGLHSMLQAAKAGVDEKITYTWAVCYVSDIKIDTSKPGWEDFECSHRCCEYDENAKRIVGLRCVDPGCLTWESKSDNQGRANAACRKPCHCGCGEAVCAANHVHSPSCL
jgi:hypothetical protein